MIAAAITPCPDCGESSSEDYGGIGLCWSCFDRRASETKSASTPKLRVAPANVDASAETDMGNARRLVRDHHDRLRYVPGPGWICWDGTRWARDSDGLAMRLAKQTVRSIDAEAAALFEAAAAEPDDAKRAKAQKAAASRLRHAQRSQGQPRLEALLTCASTESELIVHADDLDTDPWLLNTPSGTVDLRPVSCVSTTPTTSSRRSLAPSSTPPCQRRHGTLT